MREYDNIHSVAELEPDYMGFIFWRKSPRFCESIPKNIPKQIQKVGVFVDASFNTIKQKIEDFGLHAVQLHGNETPELCAQLQQLSKVIKVFSVKDRFDFSKLTPYEAFCDFYLFDTKGELPGGNGTAFDWEVLKTYPSKKPFFLSGGIGIENFEEVGRIFKTTLPIFGLDVNSKFEINPGIKDKERLQEFKEKLEL